MSLATFRATATRLITDYGVNVTHIHDLRHSPHLNENAVNTGRRRLQTLKAFLTSYTTDEIDNSQILKNDINASFDYKHEIEIGDKISTNNKIYRVMSVDAVKYKGDIVKYQVQLRI